MKKNVPLFSSLLFLIPSLFFLATPLYALDPVIIDDTRHFYPNTSGDDQNYIPSDPNSVETISVEKITNISETFDPIVLSEGSSPTYQYQNINKIEQDIDTRELNTSFFRQNYFHFSQPLDNPLAAPEAIKSTFTSYYSSHNSSRRSLPAATQRCFISQQISDISTFIESGNSICIDREITTSVGKLRVGEIISALIKNGLGKLYYPDPKCPPDQRAEEFPPNVLAALSKQYPSNYNYSLSIAEYQHLYLYGIEPICTNSLAQSIVHCDLDDSGNKVNCKDEIRSEPLAAATANENIYRNYLPQSTDNLPKDYSVTVNNPPETDLPNPIGWLAQFFKNFFEGILEESETYSGPHSVTTKIDSRQATGLKAHETAIKNFIPNSMAEEVKDLPASGTNNITVDPGNSNALLENKFFDLTRPASWKN